tara:strand:- start:4115 stop:5008 length:894 start_codon:yes stop_codon:yes gene_type:complete
LSIIKGNIFLLIASFIWGTAFVAQATGMEFIGPLTFTTARFFLGAITVIPLLLLYELNSFNKNFRNPGANLIILIASCGLGFGAIIQQYALLYTDVSNAAFITALYVPMVPIALKIFFKKDIHWSIWLAVFLCLLGLYFLTFDASVGTVKFSDIILIFAAIAFSVQIICTDLYLKKNQAPFTLAFFQYFIVFLATLFPAILLEKPTLQGLKAEYFEVFYAGVLSVGIAYTLQIIGQNITKPATTAIILSMEAVFAAIAGWVIINQTMSETKIFGCFLIFIGIIIAQIFPLKKINKYE